MVHLNTRIHTRITDEIVYCFGIVGRCGPQTNAHMSSHQCTHVLTQMHTCPHTNTHMSSHKCTPVLTQMHTCQGELNVMPDVTRVIT